MKIHFLRGKTYIIYTSGKKILVNPVFGEGNTLLPLPIKDIIKDINGICLEEITSEYFDETARKSIQHNIKIYVKTEQELKQLHREGFKNVEPQLPLEIQHKIEKLKNKLKNYFPINGEILLFE